MKAVILSGPGEVAKRIELLKIKQSFHGDILGFDYKQTNLSNLKNFCLSIPLFVDNQRLIIIENIPSSFDLGELQGDQNLQLVLLADNLPPNSTLLKTAQILSAKILLFEEEKERDTFPFLDGLIEGKKTAFFYLEKLLEQYNESYILAMIYYLLRRNLLPLPASAFLKKKIIQQKKPYLLADWIGFYQLTLETEFKIKSGLAMPQIALTNLVQQFLNQRLS